jgi:putative methyltransferase (TIGR04325 family)
MRLHGNMSSTARSEEAIAIAASIGPRNTVVRRARHLARQLLPPIVSEPLRRRFLLRQAEEEWQYRPQGWPEDNAKIHGWNAESVAATQLARWPAFVRSVEACVPFGLSHEAAGELEPDYGVHNTVMSFGYVLARAAHGRDRISMLDWGGGIGHYYVYARALLPQVELDYHCRDLPLLTKGGRQLLPAATFHDSDQGALARRYDLVLASSSLHYAKEWRTILASLASVTDRYLYVTRQPFVASVASFVVVQRPHRHGYLTEYPGWFLNRHEFLEEGRRLGLEMLREFLIAERPMVPGAPEQAEYRGFLFAAPSRQATA